MKDINNINTYVHEMSKSLEDKLWFKRFLDINVIGKDVDIYDFGCGDGTLIKALSEIYPNNNYIGIDFNPEMIALAKENNKNKDNIKFYSEAFIIIPNRKRILILSSVFHEIFNYSDWNTFYKEVINCIKPDYILFRDMAVSKYIGKTLKEDIEKVFYNYNYVSFVNNWGYLIDKRSFIHFLLKYRYVENWDREVKENYLPISYENIPFFFKDYIVVYSKHYTLPFIKDKVKENFDVDLYDKTHANFIFKLRDK